MLDTVLWVVEGTKMDSSTWRLDFCQFKQPCWDSVNHSGFIILLIFEILIGLYVHDSFFRPYFGDTLVVILLWVLVRVIIPRNAVWVSGAVFAFAVLIELSQLIPLVDLLGIKNQVIRALMGTSFAFGDLLAYAAGCLITEAIDLFNFKKRKNSESKKTTLEGDVYDAQ